MTSSLLFLICLTGISFLYLISHTKDLTDQFESNTEFLKHLKLSNLKIKNLDEVSQRYKIYKENFKFVDEINKKHEKTYFGLNEFALHTWDEFKNTMSLEIVESKKNKEPTQEFLHKKHLEEIHSEMFETNDNYPFQDWRNVYDITPVRNQGNTCSSGHAFAVAGVMESFSQFYYKQTTMLSPQQILDCSKAFGNYGCKGGFAENGMEFVKRNGITRESDYPYYEKDGNCDNFVTSFVRLPNYGIAQGKDQIIKSIDIQPLIVGFSMEHKMMFYKGGIYESCDYQADINHFGVAVGYSLNPKMSHFVIIKNSFGNTWGDHGYLYLSFNACLVSSNNHNIYIRN